MAIGKIRSIHGGKSLNFQDIQDNTLREAANKLGDKINQRQKQQILWYYYSKEMRDIMKEEKKKNMAKPKTIRKALRIPIPVQLFLDAYFEPEYGQDWIQNKKLWRHELVRPWLVIDH